MNRINRILIVLIVASSLAFGAVTASAATPRVHRIPWYEPLLRNDRAEWATWTCVIRAESRSTWTHPNLGDNRTPAMGPNSGIFQIQDPTFHAHFGVKTLHVWQATPRQQAIAAMNIRWADHDDGLNGFGPWKGDGCF